MDNQPPRFGRWLLRCIYDDDHLDEVSGDLEEIYYDRLQSHGRWIASISYIKDVILSIRNLHLFRINPAMIQNLVTIAFRSLKKRLSYSILNIAGLATSIAFAFLLWLYVQDQTSYDKHFPLADRIYRVNLETDMGGKQDIYANVPQPLSLALKATYPQIEEAPRIALADRTGTFEYHEKELKTTKLIFADPAVLKLFQREFIEGNVSNALSVPGSVVIGSSFAMDLFGTNDVLGKVVHFVDFDKDLKVTGVIADDPRRSHIPIEIIIAWDTFKELESDQWYGAHTYAYVLLNEENDIAALEQQMPAFFDRFLKKTFDEFGGKGRVFFQRITDIHLSEELVWEPTPHGSKTNVLALSMVALLLIGFAVINYVNLATAQAASRATEVSIRKTMGSSKQLLWAQFISESLLLAITAGGLSLLLAWAMLPYFNSLTAMDLHAPQFFTVFHLRSILLLATGIGLLAGIFPAFYLSSSPAVDVLKGRFVVSSGGEILRKGLVTTQYFIVALLISGILLVYNQVNFIKTRDLGFNKQNLISIKVSTDSVVNNHIDVYMNEIKASSKILSASLAQMHLEAESNSFSPRLQNEDGSIFQMGSDLMFVDADFLTTIGAQVVAGRNFDRRILNESDRSVLINEAAARKFGWEKNPLGGKFAGFTPEDHHAPRNVIGVVKDFHVGVSYQMVHPIIIFLSGGGETNLLVRTDGSETKETLAMMETAWQKHFPDYKMEYSFVDMDLEALYNREDNFLSLLTCFCVVIMLIASLGIIGLISYTTESRKREIAIRKVLGSSFQNIIAILTKKFMALLIIANVLAVPATWWLVRLWLDNFAYRAELSPTAFAVPFGICILFTGLSIAYHTTRAALANPVEALKCE